MPTTWWPHRVPRSALADPMVRLDPIRCSQAWRLASRGHQQVGSFSTTKGCFRRVGEARTVARDGQASVGFVKGLFRRSVLKASHDRRGGRHVSITWRRPLDPSRAIHPRNPESPWENLDMARRQCVKQAVQHSALYSRTGEEGTVDNVERIKTRSGRSPR